jgi:hypothetical protein
MKKTTHSILAVFLLMGLLCLPFMLSCSRGDGPVVHIAGYSEDIREGTCDALYWKNSASDVTMLNTRPHDSALFTLCISGTNVYTGGYANHGERDLAVYWKNGKAFVLSTDDADEGDERIEALLVDGDTVHAAGWRKKGKITAAMYWKTEGGEVRVFQLTDGTRSAGAFALAAANGDIYAGGIEYAGDAAVAKYWKNGARAAYPLSDGRYSAGVHALLAHNGDIYAAGWEKQNGVDVAKYWKNGPRNSVELSDGRIDARIAALSIHGEDVYAVGYEGNKGRPAARYWKNGTGHFLSGGNTDSFARSLFVYEQEGKRSVYAAGYESDGLLDLACYWRIDAAGLHVIPLGSESRPSRACAIAVAGGINAAR